MPGPAPNAQDPTHALYGWRVPAPAPLQDLALREILPQRVEASLLGHWPELAALVGAETAFGALHQLLVEAERTASFARLNVAYIRQGHVARRSA